MCWSCTTSFVAPSSVIAAPAVAAVCSRVRFVIQGDAGWSGRRTRNAQRARRKSREARAAPPRCGPQPPVFVRISEAAASSAATSAAAGVTHRRTARRRRALRVLRERTRNRRARSLLATVISAPCVNFLLPIVRTGGAESSGRSISYRLDVSAIVAHRFEPEATQVRSDVGHRDPLVTRAAAAPVHRIAGEELHVRAD